MIIIPFTSLLLLSSLILQYYYCLSKPRISFYLELIFDICVDCRKDLFSYQYLLLLPGFSLVEINVIYIHMIFTTEGLPEVAIENWPEWDLNPRPLGSVQTL